jgi:hypothetical protein
MPLVGRRQHGIVDAGFEDRVHPGDTQAQERIDAAFAVEHAVRGQAEPLQRESVVSGAIVFGAEEGNLGIPVRRERAAEAQGHTGVVVGDAAIVEPQRVDLRGDVPAARGRARERAAGRKDHRTGREGQVTELLHDFVSGARTSAPWQLPRMIADPCRGR